MPWELHIVLSRKNVWINIKAIKVWLKLAQNKLFTRIRLPDCPSVGSILLFL